MFLRHFCSRMKFMFCGLGFRITVMTVMILCLCNTMFWAIESASKDALYEIQSTEALLIHEYSFFSQVFKVLVLFLPLLPFSFSYYRDQRLGVKTVLQSKYGVRNYYLINLTTCFLGTFLSFLIPFLIEMGIDEALFTSNGIANTYGSKYSYNYCGFITGATEGDFVYGDGIIFKSLYLHNPVVYNLIYILMFSAFMGLLAVFVYSLSYWVKKYSMSLLLPVFIIYMLQRKIEPYTIELLGGTYVNPQMYDYIFIKQNGGLHWGYFGCLCLFFSLVTIICTVIKIKNDQL